jgi:hypothetical protein
VKDVRCGVQGCFGLGFRVQGLGCRVKKCGEIKKWPLL